MQKTQSTDIKSLGNLIYRNWNIQGLHQIGTCRKLKLQKKTKQIQFKCLKYLKLCVKEIQKRYNKKYKRYKKRNTKRENIKKGKICNVK